MLLQIYVFQITKAIHNVIAHTRNVSHDMPQRQFMGTSQVLEERMVEIITERLKVILKID